jgi:hypothetical protein
MVGMGAMFLDKAMPLPTTAKNQANTHQSRMGGGGTPMVATTTTGCTMAGGKTILDHMMIAGGGLAIHGEGNPVSVHAMIAQNMKESQWQAVDMVGEIASLAVHAMMGTVLFMGTGASGMGTGASGMADMVGVTKAHPHVKRHTQVVVQAMPVTPKKQKVLFR